MKIVCFHLFNDYSGSPKVLKGVIEGLLQRNIEVELYTSAGGVLDTIDHPRLTVHHVAYRFSTSAIVTIMRYMRVQLATFLRALSFIGSNDTRFYINTLLPIGPALAGKLIGKRVIYHYHENASVKSGIYRGLSAGMQKLASQIICVSTYQASLLQRKDDVTVVPNSLDPQFVAKLRPNPSEAFERKRILMLSSLKAYKGTKEFLEIARQLPQFNFELVINDTPQEIDQWLKGATVTPSENVTIHPRTTDVTPFYNQASIVLNLSNPREFVETFGLTALEAMRCALPVIVPEVGGIAEMVTVGVNGYKIDCKETDRIVDCISQLLNDKEKYMLMARNAYRHSLKFDREQTFNTLLSIFLSDD